MVKSGLIIKRAFGKLHFIAQSCNNIIMKISHIMKYLRDPQINVGQDSIDKRYSMAKSSTYEGVSTGMSSACDEEENFVYKQASDGLEFGKRHIQVLLLASLFFLSVCVRDCMGICIVAITDPTASINEDIPTYDWKNKNVIIASFFWGFMMPQLVAGISAGSAASMFFSGYLAASWYGWPMVFYIYNGSGLIWSILFCYYGRDCPGDHPTISREEKLLIENSLGKNTHKKCSTPWSKILSSSCVWAIVYTHSAYCWGFYTLISQIPIYMKEVMEFQMKSNALLSALPLLLKWVLTFVFSYIADLIINKKICSIGKTRKIMETVGTMCPCIALIMIGNSGSDQVNKCVALLITTLGLSSACYSGHSINNVDISPNHAGTIYGLSSQIGMIIACIGPLVVDFIVRDEKNPDQWRIVFYLTSGIFASATVIYGIFGSGKVQIWNVEIQTETHLPEHVEETNNPLRTLPFQNKNG
ncbi:hypothetical protein JTB14_000471 [Gonioctena quinquepunctata]|nr:hypothetical protein JTB14_000471 [Gonioctena quinquepunctata]